MPGLKGRGPLESDQIFCLGSGWPGGAGCCCGAWLKRCSGRLRYSRARDCELPGCIRYQEGDRLLAAQKEDMALAVSAAATINPKPTPEVVVATPALQAKAKPKEPAFIPRHWHDNAASGYQIRKRSAAEVKRRSIQSDREAKTELQPGTGEVRCFESSICNRTASSDLRDGRRQPTRPIVEVADARVRIGQCRSGAYPFGHRHGRRLFERYASSESATINLLPRLRSQKSLGLQSSRAAIATEKAETSRRSRLSAGGNDHSPGI